MDRFIEIKGAYNVRDIGGYQTKDGKTVKWKQLFRSGKISKLSENQHEKMKFMNIKSICDFRTTAEQAASPDTWYDLERIQQFSLPIGEGRLDRSDWLKNASKGTGKDSHLYQANRSYVLKNADRFKAFFEILLDEQNYPILFHCTAGKDRTGFATVLLLYILGVDKAIIVEDYLLTNDYLDKYFWKEMEANAAKYKFDLEAIKPILIADKIYLEGAFDAIKEHYGTLDNFIKTALNIGENEVQKLRSLLLE